MWDVEFAEGYAADLATVLNRRTTDGWTVRYVIVNGVNRWTVVCWKDV